MSSKPVNDRSGSGSLEFPTNGEKPKGRFSLFRSPSAPIALPPNLFTGTQSAPQSPLIAELNKTLTERNSPSRRPSMDSEEKNDTPTDLIVAKVASTSLNSAPDLLWKHIYKSPLFEDRNFEAALKHAIRKLTDDRLESTFRKTCEFIKNIGVLLKAHPTSVLMAARTCINEKTLVKANFAISPKQSLEFLYDHIIALELELELSRG